MTIPATIPQGLAVQYESAPGLWTTLASCDVGTILRTRRLASPPGRPVTARRWRVVKIGDIAVAGVASLKAIAFHRETDLLSPHKRWSFDFDASDQRYGLIATDGNVEVYRRGERVASIASPYGASQVTAVQRAQTLDTLLAFHEDLQPHRFMRQGAHTEWDVRPQELKNIPLFDYLGTRAGGTSEVQQLSFTDFLAGETFNLTLEEETTTAIAYSTNMATLAGSVAAALNNLSNVGAAGVAVVSPSDKTLTVSFQGDNANDDVGELASGVLSSEKGILRTATVTQGKVGGEPVISTARGWPAAGVFHEGRLVLAGLKSRPQTVLTSRQGFFFDLKTGGGQSDKGIDVDLATDQSTRILGLFSGRHLQVFSQSAEFFNPSKLIAPVPEILRSSSYGTQPATPRLEMEGGTLFVTAGGDAIAHNIFTDAAQSYDPVMLSTYAPHLVKGIVAGGFRRHRSTSEPNLAMWIRSDGQAAAMTAILAQEVLGFTRWTTDGGFTEAGGELAGDLYACTRREDDIGVRHRLEVLSDLHMLDASVRLVVDGAPVETVGGLDHLEGRTVVAYVDGGDAGDVVVTAGAVTLPYPAERSVEVGLPFTPRGRLLPFVLQQDPRGGASMHARTGEINFRLGPTANLRAGMAGKKMWPVNLKRRGGGPSAALLDSGPGEDAFEGWTRLYPIPGFQDDAQIEFIQDRPGPLDIREIVATVQS